MDPGQVVQETYTVEEDPQEAPPVVSVETGEDGTTRRTETTVTPVDGKQRVQGMCILQHYVNVLGSLGHFLFRLFNFYRVRTVTENLGKAWNLKNAYFQEQISSQKFWKSHGNVLYVHLSRV